MLWKDVCEVFRDIENTSKRLEKRAYFIKLIEKIKNPEDLKNICYISIGRVFPEYDNRELGVGEKLLINAIVGSGINKDELLKMINKTGDIGLAVEEIKKKQKSKIQSLFYQPLTVNNIINTLRRVAEIEGEGSIKKKQRLISSLFINASPLESRYLVRLILGDMRIGMNVPTILEALSIYYKVPKEKLEKIYSYINDIGLLAESLAKGNIDELNLELFRPIKPMLAQLCPSIEEALLEMGTAQFETKYDGARLQIHKGDGKVKIYSRNLEDITNAFPELVDEFKKFKNNIIVEGECVAIGEDGKPKPFQ